jgi:hypothetical protein
MPRLLISSSGSSVVLSATERHGAAVKQCSCHEYSEETRVMSGGWHCVSNAPNSSKQWWDRAFLHSQLDSRVPTTPALYPASALVVLGCFSAYTFSCTVNLSPVKPKTRSLGLWKKVTKRMYSETRPVLSFIVSDVW